MTTTDTRAARRITLTYTIIAFLWIGTSDALLAVLFGWNTVATTGSVVKGLLFVLITSTVLYVVLKREFARRRSAEEVMQRNQQLYQTLAHHYPDGAVFLFDPAMRFVLADGSALDVLSNVAEVSDRTVAEIFEPVAAAVLEPRMRAALNGEHLVFNLEIAERSYQANCFAINDAAQSPLNGMLLIQDVTARRDAEAAVLQERMRISRDLHDSVSQALYGIGLATRTARTLLERDPQKVVEPLDYIASMTEMGIAELRGLLFELRTDSLEVEGLTVAIEKQAAAMRAQYGLSIITDLCSEPEVRLQLKEVIYRISQEALHNVVKHAKATQVMLTLTRQPNELRLSILDNGVGLNQPAQTAGSGRTGMGLRSMRERAERVGGSVAIQSEQGQFTKVEAVIPI